MPLIAAFNDIFKHAFDKYSGTLAVITEPHKMIHDGNFFQAAGIVASLANSANLDLLFRLPAGTISHVTLVEFSVADGPLDIFMYEGTTTSADGTAANVRNHNRVSSNDTSSAVMTIGPTVTDVGTELDARFIPDVGGPGNRAGGLLVAGEDTEWVIGSPVAETTYLWRVTNNSGGAIKLSYHFNGYELP